MILLSLISSVFILVQKWQTVLMWENVLHRLSETFIYTEQADSVSYLVYNKIQDKSC